MSGLPPLKAATTLPPVTCCGVLGSLSNLVKAMTCEVSRPIKPIWSSAPEERWIMANKNKNLGKSPKCRSRRRKEADCRTKQAGDFRLLTSAATVFRCLVNFMENYSAQTAHSESEKAKFVETRIATRER